MRRAEPLEPEIEAGLEAIDATLDGRPVDPEHAELAELSLILRSERPELEAAVATSIDARVGGRFDRTVPGPRRWLPPRGWAWGIGLPAGAAAVLAALALTGAIGGGSGSGVSDLSSASTNGGASAGASVPGAPPRHAEAATGSSAAGHPDRSSPQTPAPTAAAQGRQIVQAARLSLSTAPAQINTVAQQVFDVIGTEKGYVSNSSVTATGHPDSNATFELSVPSDNLQQTLNQLSRMHGANVVSSTDTTADITAQVGGAGRRLAEARALQRSLLRQLAAAYTTEQIDSLKLRIRDADQAIARAHARLAGLHRQVAYSRIALTIQGSAARSGRRAHSGGFTLRRAAHDALHVLVVAAGVLLIALAVAIPVALVVALIAWLWQRLRRRAREAALERS